MTRPRAATLDARVWRAPVNATITWRETLRALSAFAALPYQPLLRILETGDLPLLERATQRIRQVLDDAKYTYPPPLDDPGDPQ